MKALRVLEGSTCDMSFIADGVGSDRDRLHAEFLSMPALCLTVEQTARLLSVSVATASRLLAELERDGFLTRAASGRYRLAESLIF